MEVTVITRFFIISGITYSRTQYPLQNAFALTVHQTQSLSLNNISLALDGCLFSPGQAYTALSRATTLAGVNLTHLDKAAFLVDQEAVIECGRLENLWKKYQGQIDVRRQ